MPFFGWIGLSHQEGCLNKRTDDDQNDDKPKEKQNTDFSLLKIDLQVVSSPEILATTAPNVIRYLVISSFIVIIHHHQHNIIVIKNIIITFVIIIIIVIIVSITMIVTNNNIADKFWDEVREMQPFCGGGSGQCTREYISPGEIFSRCL